MTGRRDTSLAQLERDAALKRISRTRRWVLIGAAALTAGFAFLVSALAPGRSLGAKSQRIGAAAVPRSSAAARSTAPAMPPLATPTELGLQGPGQAPQPPPQPPQVAPSDPSQSQAAAPAPAPQPPVVSGGS